MSVTSIPHTSAAPNWYCTRCKKPFLDTTDEQPCPRCGQGDQIVGYEEEPKKAAPTKAAAHKPSAMFRRASIERSRTGVERISAWGVLLLSVFGTVIAFHGGWDAFLEQRNPTAIGIGVVLQIGLTYVQWAYYRHRVVAWGSRLVDTFLTALGYGPLFLAPLAALFVSVGITSVVFGWPGALVAAAAAISLASYGLAWYPESRLVD
jgi:hypothetical protein